MIKDWLKGAAVAALICTAPDGSNADPLTTDVDLPKDVMTEWHVYSGTTTDECWDLSGDYTERSMCWVAAMNDRQEAFGAIEAQAYIYRKLLTIGYTADMENWNEDRFAAAIMELNNAVVRFLNDAYTIRIAFRRPLTMDELSSLFNARIDINRLLPGG